jgi:hypothetical protein
MIFDHNRTLEASPTSEMPPDCLMAGKRAEKSRTKAHASALTFLLVFACLATGILGTGQAARADSWHHGVLYGASSVNLSYLGFHRHLNNITFLVKRLSMRDPSDIYIVPHCELSTWVPGWGSIENWVVKMEGNNAVVVAPTRFADLLELLATGPVYYQNWPYYADVWWYGP